MAGSLDKTTLEDLVRTLHGVVLAIDKEKKIIGTYPEHYLEKYRGLEVAEVAGEALTLGKDATTLFPEADSLVLCDPSWERLKNLHKAFLRARKRIKRERQKFQEAIYGLERRNKQSIREMNLAVEMQKSMLPRAYPDTAYFSCTHRYIPMAMVGGDYFDIFKIDDKRFGIMISDVSGHGIAPAFITAMIKSTFDYIKTRHVHPSKVIRSLNEEFSKVITTNHYVTAFYGILDFEKFTMEYCNAGHPGQLIAHVDGSFTEMKSLGNPIIGLMDDFAFKEAQVEFYPGDLFCFYTDGIIESRGLEEKMFGLDGIKQVITDSSSLPLDSIADTVLTELIQFMENPVFEDDITLFLIGTSADTGTA